MKPVIFTTWGVFSKNCNAFSSILKALSFLKILIAVFLGNTQRCTSAVSEELSIFWSSYFSITFGLIVWWFFFIFFLCNSKKYPSSSSFYWYVFSDFQINNPVKSSFKICLLFQHFKNKSYLKDWKLDKKYWASSFFLGIFFKIFWKKESFLISSKVCMFICKRSSS